MEDNKYSSFLGSNDWAMIQHLNKEFIEDVVTVPVYLYKVEENKTERNMYEEPTGPRRYHVEYKLYGLVDPQDQQLNQAQSPGHLEQTIRIEFQRERLKEKNVYPDKGDIIFWGNSWFEISEPPVDNTLLASNPNLRHGLRVEARSIRESNIDIDNIKREES